MNADKTVEDKTRLAIHDILVHLHKTWDAFSEAAREMKLTPEQAEASLLAKAVLEIKEEPETDEEKIANYLKTSFVLWAAGLLPQGLERKLDSMADAGAGDWKASVVEDLGADAEFIGGVYAACTASMSPEEAVHFILRGLRVVPSIDALCHAAKAGGRLGQG